MDTAATLPERLTGLSARSALVVVAHPDDESFGLGAVLATLSDEGVEVRVVCFTRGEASTLGAVRDLGEVRARELERAAEELGVRETALFSFPDGHLEDVPAGVLDAEIEDRLRDVDLLVGFESGGVTGHPDHRVATAVAERVGSRHGIPVLEWGVPSEVAETLNNDFGTRFVAASGVDVEVDRTAQWNAIRCHESQAHDNPVLRRRLALQGNCERLRLVWATDTAPSGGSGRVPGELFG